MSPTRKQSATPCDAPGLITSGCISEAVIAFILGCSCDHEESTVRCTGHATRLRQAVVAGRTVCVTCPHPCSQVIRKEEVIRK